MHMKGRDRIVLTTGAGRRRARLPAGARVTERRLAAARLLAKLSECRDWVPDRLRAMRLDALRHAVQSGTYRIDHQRTARAMLGEIIGEALA